MAASFRQGPAKVTHFKLQSAVGRTAATVPVH
jgi:hypothetical protein